MIEFLYLLTGFFAGLHFGARYYQDVCADQINSTGTIKIKSKVYSLSEMGAKGEK